MNIDWVIAKRLKYTQLHLVTAYTVHSVFRIYSCCEDQSKQAGWNEAHYREMHFEVAAPHRKEHSTCNEVFPGKKKRNLNS